MVFSGWSEGHDQLEKDGKPLVMTFTVCHGKIHHAMNS